jgi:hypothetical protein
LVLNGGIEREKGEKEREALPGVHRRSWTTEKLKVMGRDYN